MAPLILTGLVLNAIIVLSHALGRVPAVRELDAVTFAAAIDQQEQDSLIFFAFSNKQYALETMDALAERLGLVDGPSASISLYIYDVERNGGLPSSVRLHTHGEEAAVVLFPATGAGREPTRYDFSHDPLSIGPAKMAFGNAGSKPASERGAYTIETDEAGGEEAGSCGVSVDGEPSCNESSSSAGSSARPRKPASPRAMAGEHHEHDHGDGHDHAPRPSMVGMLRWLKGTSTFPSDIPSIELSELWEGREDELLSALGGGLQALRARIGALQRDNARLKTELKAAEAALLRDAEDRAAGCGGAAAG